MAGAWPRCGGREEHAKGGLEGKRGESGWGEGQVEQVPATHERKVVLPAPLVPRIAVILPVRVTARVTASEREREREDGGGAGGGER